MIRPLLRANATRLDNVHVVVFFIILVANVGGALSPLGDPPLFVGFLRGVDFFWTTRHLLLPTAFVAGLVFAGFVALDLWFYRKDRRVTMVGETEPPRNLNVRGGINLLLIAGIIAAILGAAAWKPGVTFDAYGTALELQNIARDVILLLLAFLSLVLTPNEHREANGFTWEPILEVAILFAGIFACIIPVLAMLEAGRDGSFSWLLAAVTARDGSPHDVAYFWVTGALSALADGPAWLDPGGDLHGRGLHGRAHLYRQRAQSHDLCHRGRTRREDAELLRLSRLGERSAAAGPGAAHLRFRPAALGLAARAPRTAACGLARAAFSGSTATASISKSAASRANFDTAIVVLAGSAAASR